MLDGRRIAVIEDDAIMGESLVQRLALEGAEPLLWRTGREALRAHAALAGPVDAVVCDIRLPDLDGEAIFMEIARAAAPPPFLFLTAHGDIDQAVRLLRAGAADYLTKPFEMDTFLARLAAVAVGRGEATGPEGALGVSPPMRRVEAMLARLADHALPVLLSGETGAGKEVAARHLHARSARAGEPFVAVNCAAIPAELLESEIFGHEKGAFSGAHARHAGVAERAGGGTLFLDEIGDMALPMQAKLLRLIEDAAFFRIGGERPVAFRARIVSATHCDLAALAAEGRFRQDLLFRLNAVEVALPPLRAREADIPWLMRRFFEAARARGPTRLRAIGSLAEEAALSHGWPGNVRELRNRIDRAVALAEGEVLGLADLFPEFLLQGGGEEAGVAPLAEARAAAERRQISRALEHTGGRIAEAAALLQVSRTTLWEKMQRLEIRPGAAGGDVRNSGR
ncbi:sigma-54 dependent transcriptional regulator [Paralimibaculum aggregatum]|uniref:Sigma-54 dependent transcriptional regulator n=1 Tax=Paralimibaculum aggregatum TaxID=3036245 RepID=A0ABQ6LSM5_9RHOB|nr:sigma-54 dependent transcriptional regulator [Limibaculum sp. NKW23]GMG85082.1 sigma-54 dependent transcriptional regulator [Limibaculum sp. NKW23]